MELLNPRTLYKEEINNYEMRLCFLSIRGFRAPVNR